MDCLSFSLVKGQKGWDIIDVLQFESPFALPPPTQLLGKNQPIVLSC